jgi:hypothetical protein
MRLIACAAFALAAIPTSAQVLADFEHNNPALYTTASGSPITLQSGSAHNGLLGARPGSGWNYNSSINTAPGNTYRAYVRLASTGRVYIGVGASAAGCFSMVFAPNTSTILIQENSGFGYSDLASAAFVPKIGTWYQLELDWAMSNDMTVNVYDEAGATLLATTGPAPTTASAGGLALREFGSGDVDTIRSGAGPVVNTYCTAKQNSLGCTPTISGAGVPSASLPSGFTVDVAMVRNQRPGLFFYTSNGAQAGLTFQCGTLCVGPTNLKRTPARSAGGNALPANDCSGVYSIDMNAFAAGMAGGNPDPALGVMGTTVHAQAWGRDQGFASPCNTTLSDGLEYVVGM